VAPRALSVKRNAGKGAPFGVRSHVGRLLDCRHYSGLTCDQMGDVRSPPLLLVLGHGRALLHRPSGWKVKRR
jgi:hypothetical protein